jgi:osmotically-inducible protein OsmY
MTQTQYKTDHELKIAIEEELDWTPAVKADRVGVAVNDGAVTLSGEVESYPEKHAAVQAALRVRGVTAIADEIVVESPWGSLQDADIAREAGARLDRSVVVPADAVKATVHDHIVTLSGTVPWQYQREAAQHAVAELRGVREVRNSIILKPPTVVSASSAKSKITSALVRNAQLDANRIQVKVDGQQVELTGVVSSWAERRQAEKAAWSAPGVTKVSNHLVVSV